MKYDSLIWSEEELIKFYDTFFSEADPFHTDFFCIAARRKYMTEEERRTINLGDTCMMFKTVLKEYNVKKFLSKIHQADASASYFTDRDDNFLPRSCIVFYMNLNRTNVLKAVKDFKDLINAWDYDLATAALFNNSNKKENLGRQLKTIQNNLLKSFQDPKNTEGNWLDIDCDIKGLDEETLIAYKKSLVDLLGGTDVYIIHTHGGCHVIISKELISNYNKHMAEVFSRKEMKEIVLTPAKLLSHVREMIVDKFSEADVSEIKFNQNLAVPIPGTLQGGFPVKMI